MKSALRIGLLVDSDELPAWAVCLIRSIQATDCASIKLVVRKTRPVPSANGGGKNLLSRTDLFYKLYARLDRTLFPPQRNAFVREEMPRIEGCSYLNVAVRETKFSDYVDPEDIERIGEYRIDVFVRLGFRILRGDILTCARYGIWSYHHGDNRINRGGPPGVWEVLERWDETGVVLQVLTEDLDGGTIIARSTSATYKESVSRNKNAHYWKAISLLPRKLTELHRMGGDAFLASLRERNAAVTFYSNRLYLMPRGIKVVGGMIRNFSHLLARKVRDRLVLRQWILCFCLSKEETLSRTLYRFKRILPPKDRFYADPFVLSRNGKYYIFIEELLYATGRGRISLITMEADGTYGPPRVILEKEYHLSYPFLLEEDGELYLIPESAQNGTIDLYRCVEFPDRWEHCETLMDGVVAVDTTILHHEGRYWMFVNQVEQQAASYHDELFLYSSPTLRSGNWTPHPMNPIVSDVRSARPAGNLFHHGGKLYRPAQNCAKRYGYAIVINEVEQLDAEVYRERRVSTIEPNWSDDLLAVHTLNQASRLTVVDAMVKRWR